MERIKKENQSQPEENLVKNLFGIRLLKKS